MAFASFQDSAKCVRSGFATGVSRREAIAAGGLAIAGATGLAPATSSPIGIVFGADRGGYRGLHRAAPLAVGLRWYFNVENRFPPANNARTARRIQEHGLKLCQGTRVLFGVITVGPVADQLDWMAPDLDWYGDDLYEFAKLRGPNNTFSKKKVIARLYQNLHAWQKKTGQEAPAIRICETNSPYNSHRSAFFTTIANFLARHNGNRMLTFWSPNGSLARGGLDGPWPPSESVIKTLTSLTKEYDWKTL